jgi:hypothetical protein
VSWLEKRTFAAVDRLADRAAQILDAHVAPLTAPSAGPRVLPAVDDPAYARQAEYAVGLGMRRTWVTRRNETFTFVDADTVRRRMSVDFTLPPTKALSGGDIALVPLMLLAKGDLRNLDVHNAAGEALPVLSTVQNATVSVLGLKGLLERLVEHLPAEHPDRLVDDGSLSAIACARPPYEDITGARKALDRQLRHAGDTRPRIEGFIGELERYFMLLVPLEYWAGERHVCKLSYDAAIQRQHASGGARFYTGANHLLSSFGLAGRVEFFDNLAVGLTESYHAEAVPPRDTYIAEAALAVRRPGKPADEVPITDRHAFRPHLRVTSNQRGDEGKLSLIIHAHRGELLLPLALSSLLITVALGFLPVHVYRVDGVTLGALLLVPFALSSFYVRAQENSYVTSLLRGVRVLALLPLLAAVWTIGLVALGTIPPEAGARLSDRALTDVRVPFLVAAGPTALLLLATVSSGIGRIARPIIRARQERAREAAGRRFEAARQIHVEPAQRRIQAIGRALLGAVVALVILGLVIWAGWYGASEWWDAAVPTAPPATLQQR